MRRGQVGKERGKEEGREGEKELRYYECKCNPIT